MRRSESLVETTSKQLSSVQDSAALGFPYEKSKNTLKLSIVVQTLFESKFGLWSWKSLASLKLIVKLRFTNCRKTYFSHMLSEINTRIVKYNIKFKLSKQRYVSDISKCNFLFKYDYYILRAMFRKYFNVRLITITRILLESP